MNKQFFYRNLVLFIIYTLPIYLSAQQKPGADKRLQQQFNLVPAHSKDLQFYVMESKLLKYELDGTRKGWDIYRLYLRCVPLKEGESENYEYTCVRFTVQSNNSPEAAIPSLSNWKYFFSLDSTANGKKGQLFGIDHSKFERLTDEKGKALPLENTFHVYNAFIDFHSMSVFAEKTPAGRGVQDLKKIGTKIVHGASFSQPQENLGSHVAEGSYFKNGEITLEFKGLGLVNNKTCALLEYDSGESSFYMVTKPLANMDVKTKGSSHYFGDIYKDLDGGWIQKAILHEWVVSETMVPGLNKINSVIERTITINNVGEGRF